MQGNFFGCSQEAIKSIWIKYERQKVILLVEKYFVTFQVKNLKENTM